MAILMMMIFKTSTIINDKRLIRQEFDRISVNAEVQHAKPTIEIEIGSHIVKACDTIYLPLRPEGF
jgi:hypothetical protein